MKSPKILLITLLACLFFSYSATSLAEDSYGAKVGQKALRGLSNTTLSLMEIPKNIIMISNDSNVIFGVSGGLLLGCVNTLGRFSVGAFDLITVPLATKPIVQPIHPWSHYLNVETNYNPLFALDF